MQITINSVPYFIQGGNTLQAINVPTVATSMLIVNLSMTLNGSLITTPSASTFSGIAWNGTVFCAIPAASGAVCYTSPDGITWTQRTLPATNTWNGLAWNGTNFCTVGSASGTAAATSPDGITWTLRTLPGTGTWAAISWNGTVFCAVASQSGTMAGTSPDGITWTLRTLPATATWTGIVWNGSLFYAYAGGSTSAGSSPDGITWTARTSPASTLNGAFAIAANTGTFVANSGVGIFTSTDAITWTSRTLPIASALALSIPNYFVPSGAVILNAGIIYVDGQFMISAFNITYNTYIGNLYYVFTSPDGINWNIKQVYNGINYSAFAGNAAANTTRTVVPTGGSVINSSLAPNPFAIYAQPTLTV